MTEQIFSVQPNAPFKWPKGVRLFATARVKLVLPGAVVKNGETIGSVVEVSDDNTRIGFQEGPDKGEAFTCIILELEPGASVRLHRSSDAMALSDSEALIIFKIEGEFRT